MNKAGDIALWLGIGAAVGLAVGMRLGTLSAHKKILAQRITTVNDVAGVLSAEQANAVQMLLDAGGDVLQARFGTLTTILAKVGDQKFQALFDVTAADPSPAVVNGEVT